MKFLEAFQAFLQHYVHSGTQKSSHSVDALESQPSDHDTRGSVQNLRIQFESMIRHMGEGFCEIDTGGKILSVNEATLRFLGYTKEELLGRDFHEAVCGHQNADDDSENAQRTCPILSVLSTHNFFESDDIHFLRQDGTRLTVYVTASPFFSGSPQRITGAIVVLRDISSRKKMEMKLRESEEKYRKIVRNSPDGIFLFDPESYVVLDANPIFCDMIGFFFRETLVGKRMTEFCTDSEEFIRHKIDRLREKGLLETFRTEFRRFDQTRFPVSISATTIPFDEREVVLVTVRNIALEVQSEGIARLSQEMDQRILEGIPIETLFPRVTEEILKLFHFTAVAICRIDSESRYLPLSIAAESDTVRSALEDAFLFPRSELYGFSPGNVPFHGNSAELLDLGDYSEEVRPIFEKIGMTASLLYAIALPDRKPVSALSVYVKRKEELTEQVIVLLGDLSKKLAIAYLHEQEQSQIRLQKMAMESVDSPMFITGPEGRIEWANLAYLQLKGVSLSEIQGKTAEFFKDFSQDRETPLNPWNTLRSGLPFTGEHMGSRNDGSLFPSEIRITPMMSEYNKILHLVCIESDISEEKAREEELKQKAYFDPLTHLPNRMFMEDQLGKSLAVAKRYKRYLAVLFLDLDGFKEVNDNHGHDIGDRLLLEVAVRLQQIIREGDTIARLGGDEFVILLNNVEGLSDVEVVAQRILETINRPYLIDTRKILIGTSIGISVYPFNEKDESGLLRDADLAMYQAKNSGKNNYVFYHLLSDAVTTEEDFSLGGADKKSTFEDLVVSLVPIGDFRTGAIVGFSLRIESSGPGTTSPDNNESSRSVSPIFLRWLMRTVSEACRTVQTHCPGAFLKISLSLHQLISPEFLPILYSTFGNQLTSLAPGLLFGINGEKAPPIPLAYQNVIWDLTEKGIRVGLERVGDQQNTLYLLRHLPVDFLGVTPLLVREIDFKADSMAFLGALLLMTHALKRSLFLPAVDDLETALILSRMGCDWGEGSFVGSAISPTQLPDRIGQLSSFFQLSGFETESWDLEHIPYLLGRKNHRKLSLSCLEAEQTEILPADLLFSLENHACPLWHWMESSNANSLLAPRNLDVLKNLEDRYHHELMTFRDYIQQGNMENARTLLERLSEINENILTGFHAVDDLVFKRPLE